MSLSPFGGAASAMVTVIPIVVIIIVFLFVIIHIIQGTKQWKRNNDSPVLTVEAAVVAKRSDVHHYNTGMDNMHNMPSSTTYYATFEVASGDRMEFKIRNTEYGMLAEGDRGRLTFQGTRYLGFERSRD